MERWTFTWGSDTPAPPCAAQTLCLYQVTNQGRAPFLAWGSPPKHCMCPPCIPPISIIMPLHLCPRRPGKYRRVSQRLPPPSPHFATVRGVDKGPGLVGGFLRSVGLGMVASFLQTQGYARQQETPNTILDALCSIVPSHKWPLNQKAQLALPYLIGKPKSRTHVELRRPIAAASAPLVSRHCLRVAARAYTRFVRTLVSESPPPPPYVHLRCAPRIAPRAFPRSSGRPLPPSL